MKRVSCMKYLVSSMKFWKTMQDHLSFACGSIHDTRYTIRGAGSRGFVLLLSAIVASITLAIGVSIFGIAQKQVVLSSLGRDSQFAFYAADTGAECALYWDVRHSYFGTTTPSGFRPPNYPKCDGQEFCDSTATDTCDRNRDYPQTIIFQFEPGGLCSRVSVKKEEVSPEERGRRGRDSTYLRTVIHADGYSTNCTTIGTSPRSLQRSVEMYY